VVAGRFYALRFLGRAVLLINPLKVVVRQW